MKRTKFFAVLAVLGLLASCAQMSPQPADIAQAVKSARTSADHTALAKRYEDAAKEMQANMSIAASTMADKRKTCRRIAEA